MAYTFARRAAVAVTSVAVAAAGILATGGSTSAATPTAGDRPAAVSHSVLSADAHHQSWSGRWDEHGHDGRGHRAHHHAGHRHDGHGHWVRDHDDRGRYRVSDDDARRQWVVDQINWLHDRDARR
ncbi:hypothetical protein [Streptomyces sp. NBC_01217]|uniref:hypothetical protein n=1 Tax=Streptomyces sp. NBC_01217 TaxID=2903779 RepID=UPI002E1007A4|nr:hypothetical protein OG507_38325 [Streptomyces sp. NBC_01217]